MTASHPFGRTQGELLRLIGGLFLVVAPLVFSAYWGVSETHTAGASGIEPGEGFKYAVPVPTSAFEPFFHLAGDGVRYPRRADTRVYEDARQLGPPHRPHDFIRADGRGQFSHWGSTLYFSSSDNTDPRANGRIYRFITGATASGEFLGWWAICALAVTGLAYWLRRTRRAASDAPRAWKIALTASIVATYALLVRYSMDPDAGAWVPRGQMLPALWAASFAASLAAARQVGLSLADFTYDSIEAIQRTWGELLTRANRPFMRSGWEGRAWRAASLALPVILFVIVLRMHLPYGVLTASYFLATPLLLPFGLALWCCHLRRDWIGTISGLAVTLVLFGLPLASLWWHIGTHYNAVGGLLPFSDASGYYYDARRLLQGYPFDWSARRPLFPGLLSTLLVLTGDNLQVTLAMLVVFNGVATYLLARELRESHGAAAAAVSTMVLFFFYRVDGGLGTALTENLGLGMGAIAFAVLWRNSRGRDLFGVSLGLGLLTIALMARAGAFFVLPVVVLAVALAFREKWLRAGILAFAAVFLSAGLTLFVSRLLSNPAGGQTAFSNFSLSLYGLVVGGKGWNQVLLDHPGAAEGAQIYSLAWQAFRAHPMGIVEGSLKMWATYFQPAGPHHVFAFVQDGMYGAWLQIVCYILCAIGLLAAVRKRRDAPQTLILAAALGHVASIPFVPPIDAGLRVYAATVPMIAILVSIGAAEVLHGIRRLRRMAAPAVVSVSHVEPEASSGGTTAGVIGIAVAAFVFVGPLAVLYTARSPELPSSSCPDGAKAVFVGLSAGSFLRIADDRLDLDGPLLPVPAIGQSDMRASASATELKNDAERFTAGQTMANAYDLKTGRLVWLVAPTEGQLSTSSGVFQVCGHDTLDPLSRNYAVFYGRAVALVARDQSLASRLLWAASLLATACLAWCSGLVLLRADRRSLTPARGWLTSLFANAASPFEGRGWRGGIWRAASLAIPVAVFVAVVRHSFAPRTLVASYSSVLPIALPAGIALWCCHLRRDWLGTLASLTVTLALFALPLAALWQHFGIHYNAIGGLLPFSDASGYYYDARRLIDGHPLGWSARRPSFVGFLSTLLAVTGDNLIVCVALFVALNGVATFLLARQLRITHGPAAAAVVTVVLFLFYRVEGGLGTALTENLGFALGVVAFAILWRGLREDDVRKLWLGLGVLTLALMSRAGAFLVLPALVIAGVWGFRQDRQWVRAGFGAVVAVALAAALTLGLGRILSDPASSQRALSNFSYVLYGLVVGGKGWAQVTADHPTATEGAEIYSLAWQAFRSRPAGIVEGSLRMWAAYLSPSAPYHAFAFVRDATYGRSLQLACYALCGLGLVVSLVRYRQPLYACLVAGIAAHVASIPFVPSIDAGLRVYAATVPILALLVSLGAAEALGWGSRVSGLSRRLSRLEVSAERPTPSAPSPELFGVTLALLVFIGPVYVFYSGHEPVVETATCADEAPPLHVRYSPGSYLRIVSTEPDVNDARVTAPEILETQLRGTAGAVELKGDVSRFTAGNTMVNGYDLKTGRPVWLLAPTALLPRPPAILVVCGHDSKDRTGKRYGVFYADSVRSTGVSFHQP